MPVSEGGIVRYFEDEEKSKLVIAPKYVVIACIVVAVVAVLLNVFLK